MPIILRSEVCTIGQRRDVGMQIFDLMLELGKVVSSCTRCSKSRNEHLKEGTSVARCFRSQRTTLKFLPAWLANEQRRDRTCSMYVLGL